MLSGMEKEIFIPLPVILKASIFFPEKWFSLAPRESIGQMGDTLGILRARVPLNQRSGNVFSFPSSRGTWALVYDKILK